MLPRDFASDELQFNESRPGPLDHLLECAAAEQATMKYLEIPPNTAVNGFIKCYWVLEDDSPPNSVQTIVPDGRSEIILNLGLPFQSRKNLEWKLQPACFFVGQITGPFLVRPSGPTKIIGIRFQPHGASQLLGLPMEELTDSVVSLDDISPRLQAHLEHLRELRSLSEQIAALDRIMLSCAARTVRADRLVSLAVSEFERTGGLLRVQDLADHVGLSARQFERRFKSQVGIAPKLFSRLQRFQRVFQAMDDPQSVWIDAAVDCGYYDQAHLIRDFREFSGKTPTALLAGELDLTRHFLQHHAMSHLSKTGGRRSL